MDGAPWADFDNTRRTSDPRVRRPISVPDMGTRGPRVDLKKIEKEQNMRKIIELPEQQEKIFDMSQS